MPYKAYYQANKAKCRKQANESYLRRRDKVLRYCSEYRLAHLDSKRAYDRAYWDGREDEHTEHTRKWRRDNPEKFKILKGVTKAKRRAREINAPGFFTSEDWMQKVEYYGWRCVYCNIELTSDTLTLDHVKPLSKGGSNWVSNLVPSCSPCNRKKWNHLDHLQGKISKIKRD